MKFPVKEKDKGAPKAKPMVERHQIASDTERAMLGKPQKFGAAEPDDEPEADTGGGLATPGSPKSKPEPHELSDPTDGMQEEQADPNAPDNPDAQAGGDKDAQIAQLAQENADLKSRLDKVEQHLGLNKPEDKGGAPGQPSNDADDDDYYDGER